MNTIRKNIIYAFVIVCVLVIGLSGCSDTEKNIESTIEEYEPVIIVEGRIPGDYNQFPEYPAGCEVVSLQNTLCAFDVDLTFEETYALFDKSDSDFVYHWWGNPKVEGAAYPPAMVIAANRALDGTEFSAMDITGCSFAEIEEYTGQGKLVITWYTTDGKSPRWTDWSVNGYRMYGNEHCVVVYATYRDDVYISDPIHGMIDVDITEFDNIWQECGAMAVVVG